MGFLNTVVSWFVWLFVTFVRQLGSGSLKARHLVITTGTEVWHME